MEWDDDWLAPGKLRHVLACLLISLLAAALAGRHAVAVGSAASLAVGAVKEAGFFGSSGVAKAATGWWLDSKGTRGSLL
jgi:hypothetical protein